MAHIHNSWKETFIETKHFPGWRHQLLVSGIVFVLSCTIFALLFDLNYAIEEGITFFISCSIVFLIAGLPHILDFYRIQKQLLREGQITKQNHSYNVFRIGLRITFFVLMMFGPFVLLYFVPPAAWFGSLLGIIIGLSASQFFFTLYVRQWEKTHNIKLKRFNVWSYDEKKRKVILRYGVRSEKVEEVRDHY